MIILIFLNVRNISKQFNNFIISVSTHSVDQNSAYVLKFLSILHVSECYTDIPKKYFRAKSEIYLRSPTL